MKVVSVPCGARSGQARRRMRNPSRQFQRPARSFRFLIGRTRGVTSLSTALPPSISATRRSYSAWRTSHSIGSPPKYRASLSAVSAVMPRLPRTMSLIRAGVTPMAFAVEVGLRPAGSMNSLRRISPGWTGCAVLLLITNPTSPGSMAAASRKLEQSAGISYIGIRYVRAGRYFDSMAHGEASSRRGRVRWPCGFGPWICASWEDHG